MLPKLSLPTDWLRAESGVNLAQYFGLWAVAEEPFMQMLQHIQSMDMMAHVQASDFDGEVDAQRAAAQVVAADGVEGTSPGADSSQIAVITVRGAMTKMGSSLSSAGSTIRLRRAIRSAARDSSFDAILLVIDSPGGTVAGTADLAADVAAANEEKPVFAFIEDLGASAAYWVASQAEKVYVNDPTALVGSIGTFLGLYDFSGHAGQMGIKPVVIKAGELKGAGFPGTEISQKQIDNWQDMIDKTQASFTAGVARGRGISEDAVPVTGKVYMANDAIVLGLADGVKSMDETIQELAAAAATRRSKRSATFSAGETTGITTNSDKAMPEAKKGDQSKNIDTAAEAGIVDPDDHGPDGPGAAEQAEEPQAAAAKPAQDSAAPDVAALQAKIEALEAKNKADEQRLAELEGASRKAEFEAFANDNRKRILSVNTEGCVGIMQALAAYDEMLATKEEPSALDAFKAMVQRIPEQFSADTEVTGDGKASSDEPVMSVPAGAKTDPVRTAAAARVRAYADEHELTFAQALAQLGDRAFQEA